MTKIGQKRKSPRKSTKAIKLLPLDLLFSKLVRMRADYTCEYCGKKSVHKQGLHCSHFIGRRYRRTRWLEENCACLCFSCHNLMHDFPAIHKSFFVKRIGSEEVERLENLARSGNKLDLDLIKQGLTEKLRRLQNE